MSLHLPYAVITEAANAAAERDYVAGMAHLEHDSEVDEAIASFERAAALDSHSSVVHASLADAYRLKDKLTGETRYQDAAIREAKKAESLNPDSAPVCRIIGKLRLDSGQYAQAAEDFSRAIELDPGDPNAHRLLARAYQKMDRFDIEVEGSHNYFADGVMVHNSPETTTGGKALKFYASVRLDVRRIETLKDGTDAVGNRTRVKVVKNKVASPFKQAEFDILYGKGISKEGSLIDMGVEQGFIRKSGSWFTYEGEQLGQGKENARSFLLENTDVAAEIEKKIKEKLGIGAVVTDDEVLPAPIDF